jgi:hypothetical protein
MATLGSSYLNLIDTIKATTDGKQVAALIEVLMQSNPILADAVAVECNMGREHIHAIRTGLPSVAWGALYKGVPQSKSIRQQVKDTTGFLEGMSGVDTRLLEITPNEGAIRLQEANGFLEAMNQEVATGIFYHSTAATPEKFKGLNARYGALGGSGPGNQIVDGLGSGADNTSIWFVTWGEPYTMLLYPQGTQAGLKRSDKGEQRVVDALGNPFYVKEEMFSWHVGMSVGDWRFNSRIANIDVSDAQAGTVNLNALMTKAFYKLQNRRVDRNGGAMGAAGVKRLAIYMNRDMLAVLDTLQANRGSTDSYIRLVPKEIEGQEVQTWRGIPIRETDALLNTETRVV